MPTFFHDVNEAGKIGIVRDMQPHELPKEAWSAGGNVRFRDGFAEKFLGHSVPGTPSIAPYCALACPTNTSQLWMYMGLNKVYGTDFTTHSNITRQTAGVDVDYAATADINWTGGVLNGIPVISNGVDAPQMWNTPGLSTKLAALTNWPANTLARSLRVFKQFLIAMDVTESGTRYPNVLRWSHPADVGAVPSSWDYTDTTKSAGRIPLAQTGDFIVDCLPLRDDNIVYKDNHVWRQTFLPGNNDVFRFTEIFSTFGVVGRRCIAPVFSGRHAVFTGEDFVSHDGQQAQSVLQRRMRRWLQNNIDTTYYGRSFIVPNYAKREIWLCFPATGSAFPNMALVWNWENDTVGLRDLDTIAHIEPGILTGLVGDTWASATGTWDTTTRVWDSRTYTPYALDLLACKPGTTNLFQLDRTNQFNGASFTSYIERTGIGVPLKDGLPPDFDAWKFCRNVWPRIEGTAGGVVNIYVGSQDTIGGSITYGSAVPFIIGTDQKVDCTVSGRLFALKLESTTNIDWRLHGYQMECSVPGRF